MARVKYHSGAFPPRSINYEALLPLMSAANMALGRYDGVLEGVTNPYVLLSPMMDREAEQSSRIEGTQATFEEVLEFEAGKIGADESRKADIQEIRNYRVALMDAITGLEKLPLSQRLMRNAHETLMQGVRGQHSNPGNFRSTQNWIGPVGCEEHEALFLPPPPQDLVTRLHDWEEYMHKVEPDALVQLAIVHAEFEAIHPFLDGNGRLGRMIIPLFLFEKGKIKRPSFYISEELERNRKQYYDHLRAVSEHQDWDGWCRFFLQAIVDQAERNYDKATAILALHERSRPIIADITGSQHAIRALDYFFTRPIFSSSRFRDEVDIPYQTAGLILRKLCEHKFLHTLVKGRGRLPAIYTLPELLEIIS